MESYMLLCTSAALLGAAALGGLLMAGMRFGGIPRPPSWLAMGHGMLAVAGLTLLVYAAMTTGIPPLAKFALASFILAAIGGVSMNLLFHMKTMPLPIALMIPHALMAGIGLVLLVFSIYGQPQAF